MPGAASQFAELVRLSNRGLFTSNIMFRSGGWIRPNNCKTSTGWDWKYSSKDVNLASTTKTKQVHHFISKIFDNWK